MSNTRTTAFSTIFNLFGSKKQSSTASQMAMTPEQILGIVVAAIQKKVQLKWHMRNDSALTGRTIRFMDDQYVWVDEQKLFGVRSRLVPIQEVFAVSFVEA